MEDLLKHGQVQRALLGISIIDLNATIAKEKGIKDFVHGIYVGGVNAGSAAESAGLKEGDVITHINGIAVNSASELQEIVARNRPGDKISVSYNRNDKTYKTEAILKNKNGNTSIVKRSEADNSEALGADLSLASKKELEKLGISNGVKIENIKNGKLRKAGLPNGFIIISIDRAKVSKPEDVIELLSKGKEGHLIEGYLPTGEKMYFGVG
jgi:S1-C subfamily serine protease